MNQAAAGNRRNRDRGFTLAEAVIVIVITGILAAMVAVFIQRPVKGFFDTARRASLADAADSALRRFTRDLREALPNSVRVNPANNAIEFLHMRSAGRYREQGPGNPLDFTASDTSFDVLGPGVSVLAGDSIVVYNLGEPGASAYEGTAVNPTTTRRIAAAPFGASLNSVTITPNTPTASPFPFASPAKRFQVVDTPVSYVCAGAQMRRYSGYPIASAQSTPPIGGTNALAADRVSLCSFTYATGPSQRDALVTVNLSLTDQGETVSLVYQVHVNNAP